MNSRNYIYNNYMRHHGILGQKWGERNGPPYPLGSSNHSSSEKKARWRKSLNNTGTSGSTQSRSPTNEESKKRLTDKQKKAIKIGTYELYKHGKLDNLIELGKNSVKKSLPGDAGSVENLIDSDTGFKKLDIDLTSVQRAQRMNPSHDQHNCKECSFAFAQSEIHGIDVIAKGKSISGNLRDFVGHYCQEDPDKVVRSISADGSNAQSRLERQLLKLFKDGDVGAVNFDFDSKYLPPSSTEAGHTFNWRIQNGKVEFIDSQGDDTGALRNPAMWFKSINPNKEMLYVNYRDVTTKKDRMARAMANRE